MKFDLFKRAAPSRYRKDVKVNNEPHPVTELNLKKPRRKADITYSNYKVYIEEKLFLMQTGMLEWEVYPLSFCSITNKPMYMPNSFPITWRLCEKELSEKILDFIVERDLLGKE
jgi:hypothetical protein